MDGDKLWVGTPPPITPPSLPPNRCVSPAESGFLRYHIFDNKPRWAGFSVIERVSPEIGTRWRGHEFDKRLEDFVNAVD